MCSVVLPGNRRAGTVLTIDRCEGRPAYSDAVRLITRSRRGHEPQKQCLQTRENSWAYDQMKPHLLLLSFCEHSIVQ
jgi:hypothetical protein